MAAGWGYEGCLWEYGLLFLPSLSSGSIHACSCGEDRDFHNLDSILANSIKHGLNIWGKNNPESSVKFELALC